MKSMTMKVKQTVILGLFSFLSLTSIGFLGYYSAKTYITEIEIDNLQKRVNEAYNAIDLVYKINVRGQKTTISSEDLEDLKQKILSLKIGENGHFYVLNQKGDTIMYKNKDVSNLSHLKDFKNDNFFIQEMLKDKNGIKYYNWKNLKTNQLETKIVVYRTHEQLGWMIAGPAVVDEFFQRVNELRDRLIIFGSIMVFLSFLIAFFLGKIVENKIQSFVRVVRGLTHAIEEGNLTKRAKRDEVSFEYAVMVDEINVALEILLRPLLEVEKVMKEGKIYGDPLAEIEF